jgi:hypothetical protein
VRLKYVYINAQDTKNPKAAHWLLLDGIVAMLVSGGLAIGVAVVASRRFVAVRNLLRFKKGDLLQVKGKADSIQVFSVEGPVEPAPSS